MIEIKNISKTFKNNKVLDGIDLTINQGDVVAIIGPSGTGKSTFLRCVDRLEKPETGTITIDGETQDLAPVSYTHLDVYKRQVWLRAKIIQSLLKKYLSCMESNSKNNRKIWMMQQMQKDGLMFAKKLMLSTGK